ncbi:hypothetical protein [Pseudomonas sp.]|uniref:hypothetical protein n=1 Tax=Pseudomonas sp. TaxID=306 RepID=UPI003D6F73C7
MIPFHFAGGTVTHDDLSILQDVAVAKQIDLLLDIAQNAINGELRNANLGTSAY